MATLGSNRAICAIDSQQIVSTFPLGQTFRIVITAAYVWKHGWMLYTRAACKRSVRSSGISALGATS